MKKLVLVVAVCFILCGCGVNTSETPADITRELTHADYGGRAMGSAGNIKTAEYVADYLASCDLAPLEGESYLMPFDCNTSQYPSDWEHAEIQLSNGDITQLAYGTDYTCSPPFADIDKTLPISKNQADFEAQAAMAFFDSDDKDTISIAADILENTDTVCVYPVADPSKESVSIKIKAPRGVRLYLKNDLCDMLLRENAKLSIKLKTVAAKRTADNVAGVLRGSEGKNALIVGAHFDGSGTTAETLFPSAYDNSSGVATMLYTAKLLSEKNITAKNDIIFVGFNGEEIGCVGSAAFSRYIEEKYDMVNVINIDCVGLNTDSAFTINAGTGAEDFATSVQAQIGDKISVDTNLEGSYNSDHKSFRGDSVAAICFSDFNPLYSVMHTAEDTLAGLDLKRIEELSKVLCDLVYNSCDSLYAPSEPALQEDETAQVNTARQQLIDDGTLAKYGSAYCTREADSGGAYYMEVSRKLITSVQELSEAFPCYTVPQEIGAYKFAFAQVLAKIDGNNYDSAMPITGDFQVGKTYDLTPRLVPDNLECLYTAEDGTAILLCDYYNAKYEQDAAELSPQLAGIMVIHNVYPEYGIDGYGGATYKSANGNTATLQFFDASEANLSPNEYEYYNFPAEMLNASPNGKTATDILLSCDFKKLTENLYTAP